MSIPQARDLGPWVMIEVLVWTALVALAWMTGHLDLLTWLPLVFDLPYWAWRLAEWDRRDRARHRARRPWSREQLAQPRRAAALLCAGCDYPIGDLQAVQIAGGERTGTYQICCPECGIANEIEVDADRCSACGTILSNDRLTPGQIVKCPSCRISWRIRPWSQRGH